MPASRCASTSAVLATASRSCCSGHGRVYPEKTTWTQKHRRWLAGQRFEQTASELAYLDYLAAVDGLVARRQALDERLSRLVLEQDFRSTVARLRCFRGIDTLSAFAIHVEVGDLEALQPADPARGLARARPLA